MSNLTSVALLGTTIFLLSSPAYGADQNTYRAGAPYLKTVAESHMQCAAQCRGDAQCRGWNFIRTTPGALTGICEFNSRAATPISSPVSISGAVMSDVDPLLSRAVQGGSHTVRVGTPDYTAPQAQVRHVSPRRIVKRQPVPQANRQNRPANYRTPQMPAAGRLKTDPRAPRIYGAEPSAPRPQTGMQPQANMQNGTMSREQMYYRQQYLQAQQRQQQINAERMAALQAPAPTAPANYRQPPMAPMPVMAPPAQIPGVPRQTQAPTPMPRQAQAPMPPTIPQTQATKRSLYGSLYDDLTPVPRPQTQPDNPANPDAPISTSRAVPTKPVASSPMAPPVPGLAGAR